MKEVIRAKQVVKMFLVILCKLLQLKNRAFMEELRTTSILIFTKTWTVKLIPKLHDRKLQTREHSVLKSKIQKTFVKLIG